MSVELSGESLMNRIETRFLEFREIRRYMIFSQGSVCPGYDPQKIYDVRTADAGKGPHFQKVTTPFGELIVEPRQAARCEAYRPMRVEPGASRLVQRELDSI